MESFKHIWERDEARQGGLGRTDAFRKGGHIPPSRGGEQLVWTRRSATTSLPPALGGSNRLTPASSTARGRASPERTCLMNGQTWVLRVLAQRGLRWPEARGGKERPAGLTHTSVVLLPALQDPAGLRTGAETNLTDSLANQKRGRQAEPMGELAGGRPSASSRPLPVGEPGMSPALP